MTVLALMVINKAGGLLYHRDFNPGLNNLDSNELLWLAGTFHGVHVITQQLCPAQAATGLNKQIPSTPILPSATASTTPGQVSTSTLNLNVTSPRPANASSVASVSGARPVSASAMSTPSAAGAATGTGAGSHPIPTFRPRPTGLQVLDTSTFRLHCFQTGSGLKFVLFTDPVHPNPDGMIKKLHELFADYVLKNPFYTIDMPVRCIKFDTALDNLIKPSLK